MRRRSIPSPVGASSGSATRHSSASSLRDPKPNPRDGPRAPPPPASVIIVGGGAAGLAAADMLRREGYDGDLTMISADDSPPCDRPNLSKDFLAGTAPDDWIPLRRDRVLCRAPHRARPRRAGIRDRRGAAARGPRKRHAARLRSAADRDRRGAGSTRRFPARPMRRFTICARLPTAGRSSPGPRRRGAWSSSAPVSSASRSRRRCGRAASTSTSSRPTACRWNA